MPLNIGFVTGEYPPMQGGVGAFTQALAREMAPAGHNVHIITSRLARPPRPGDRPYRFNELREPIDIGYAQLHPRARRWSWSDVSLVADIALRFSLDVINIQYQAAAFNMRLPAINFAPWRLRGLVKSVVTFHDLRVPYLFPKAGPLRTQVVHSLARLADGVIATNTADYARLQQIGLPAGRLRHIPIGSNIVTHHPPAGAVTAARATLGLGEGDFLLGYFGFLNESKGADTLLHALAQLAPQTHLVFIGGRTGDSDPANNQAFFQQLDSLIASLGLPGRVHWTDFLPDEGVSTYLHAADLVVLPYRDGVSLRRGSLMAALAHARPVLSTHPAAPIPELVHQENIWLTPAGDPAGLAQDITSLQNDALTRQRLAGAAGQVAGLFTWDKIAAQTIAFYESLGAGHAT